MLSLFQNPKKNKDKWNPNPWAICNSNPKVKKDSEKFERCVQKVKRKQK